MYEILKELTEYYFQNAIEKINKNAIDRCEVECAQPVVTPTVIMPGA